MSVSRDYRAGSWRRCAVARMDVALLVVTLLALALAGCGDDGGGGGGLGNGGAYTPRDAGSSDTGNAGGGAPRDAGGQADVFVPEEEEFLVREVAATDSFVFVPNASETSNTVARIDGRDFDIEPMSVGQQPTAVRAASVPGVGDVAYVLSEGASTVAIIRESSSADGQGVSLLPVPDEVNALRLSPDGRHLLAYIDPSKPIDQSSGVASLQTLALVRLGDAPADDAVYQLSVTRLIDDIEFTADGAEAFVIGREGINRIVLGDITEDTFIGPLDLGQLHSVLPPEDLEVEVSDDGSFLVARSSAYSGLAILEVEPAGGESPAEVLIATDAIPTDIDLYDDPDGGPSVLVTVRDAGQLLLIEVADALASPDDPPVRTLAVESVAPGLAQLTPSGDQALVYTTLSLRPELGVLDLASETVRAYELRNQIRSVALSADSRTAVVVHAKQPGPAPTDASALEFFQHNHGLTLFDLASGYRRPVILQAEPADLVVTEDADGQSVVYVMLQSADPDLRGVLRVGLSDYRTDVYRLARQPEQIGVVAGKVFVSQQADEGRITFIDVDTGAQRTVSGYELNAAID